MAEGHYSLEERAVSRTSSSRSPERIFQNFEMSEPFNPVKKEASTSSCEPPRSVESPSRKASSPNDAHSNAGAGCSNPEIDLSGGPQRMPGSPFVTPVGIPYRNVQKLVETLFSEAESTCEARIRVLEAHILDVQAQNLVLASNGSNVNSDSQHRSATTLQTQTLDLHRLVNFMESMSSRSGSSSVPRDRNFASEETVMNYVATHFNNPIESATLGLDSQIYRHDARVE